MCVRIYVRRCEQGRSTDATVNYNLFEFAFESAKRVFCKMSQSFSAAKQKEFRPKTVEVPVVMSLMYLLELVWYLLWKKKR